MNIAYFKSVALAYMLVLFQIFSVDGVQVSNRGLLQSPSTIRNSSQQMPEVISMTMFGCDPQVNISCGGNDSVSQYQVPKQEDPKLHFDFLENCTDIEPEGALMNCSKYASSGLCPILEKGYCAESCGWCCEDVDVPGTTCESVVILGLCENREIISNTFCLLSCGICEGPKLLSPPPHPNPFPPPFPSPPPSPSPPPPPPLSIQEQELNALQVLKNAINESSVLDSWTGKNVCNSWRGIVCNRERVVEITLDVGEYSPSDGTISYYGWELAFYRNVVTSIPSEWSVLEKLDKLQVRGIGLRGSLPSALSTCTSLKVVDLANNDLSGSIPIEWSEWNNIQVFSVLANGFTGSLPVQLSTWNKLDRFSVNNNLLTSTLPPQYSTFSALKYLHVDDNLFTGQVPIEYSVFSNLEYTYFYRQDTNGLCSPSSIVLFDGSYSNLC
eukprot:TRINITY_DN12106_c0_g1_i2.p1 TRINITY_DN12106_c0_g1~~TRINITY_DN12106_c0_g1_i2.p1  ORF type:complete len:441 (-),score=21.74 TRINITY_DN12106_c0_g1_i2:837-2159(-)